VRNRQGRRRRPFRGSGASLYSGLSAKRRSPPGDRAAAHSFIGGSMNLDLAGKTALVTASTAGIGYAIAEGLARVGATVWVNGRTQARVDGALDKIKAVAGDLATAEGAKAVIAALPAVDVLVNNLGGLGGIMKPFDKLEDGDWHTIFEVNVVSAVRMTQHYLPKMREKNWGRVVYISSESGVQ